MADYISLEAAIDAVDVGNLHRGIINALQAIISDIPSTDVVEVVRCKDCKRWKDPHDYECPCHTSGDPYIDYDPEPDFFCAIGERRSNDGDKP